MKKLFIVSLAVFGLAALVYNASGQGAAPASALHFSAEPDEREIFNTRVFDEPLLPIGGHPKAADNKALANALAVYASRTNLDDFSGLTDFVTRFPESKWCASLLLHLGTEYYNTGYYSKALSSWEDSWKQFEQIDDPKSKPQADRALGELARMYSKLGRMSELDELLKSSNARSLGGPGAQMIEAAKDALKTMQNHPEFCFRCGPMALDKIRSHEDPSKGANLLILESKSKTNGFSLFQVAELSRQLSMDYQMAFRSNGAPFVVPAVIHWKLGHYAALLQQDGNRLLIQDTTFLSSAWVTVSALNQESSGYFLVPPGPLPAGWRLVSRQESEAIYGKGFIGGPAPSGPSPSDPHTPPSNGPGSCGMTTYTMDIPFVSLTLLDTPVGYQPPVGPAMKFTATYNQSEPNQPATFYYSNLGPKWTCNWISYIVDNPTSPNADVTFYQSGGGTLNFTSFNTANQSYLPELTTQALLVKTSTNSYEMQFKDGSKDEFTMSDGSVGTTRRIFLTQVVDPSGNAVHLNYNANLCITSIVDTINQVTTFLYTNQVFPNAVTSVMDPFGRAANFQYNSNGLLTQITDVLGLTSQFSYGTNDFITTLVTPYGTTFFSGTGWGSLTVTDPLGQTEYLLNDESTLPHTIASAQIPHGMAVLNGYFYDRNSLYWDKKAYADGAGDYTKAKIYHFCHLGSAETESQVLEYVKPALENETFFNYPGQIVAAWTSGVTMNRPCAEGRVLDDGTSQLYYSGYNSLGNLTNSIDPVGRTFSYIYATNNVDLLQKVMTHNGKHEVQSTTTYNTQHLPLTITDAAGQTTTNTYNARGQIFSTTNPKGEVTVFNYDTNGYLTSIVGHLQNTNDVISFTYDAFGRVRTRTDSEGYILTYDYDVFDRKTKVTHPDGTFEQLVYNRLDLVASADRLGHWTTNTYDSLRRLVQSRDSLGRVTQYQWCKCGAMTGLTDPMGRTTTWDYDVQSRQTAKHYADGSTITYKHENTTSRLKSKIDEQGQETDYEYYEDNNRKRVSYPNAIVPTPLVTFTYDPEYNRILTMQDGIGTTTYAYNPITAPPTIGAGKVASVSGPLPNSTVTYQYDQLGRAVSRVIGGVASSTTFDVLDRPSVVTNALGLFQYSYVDATTRLASEGYPNGQTNLYTYYNNLGDERLQQIRHLFPNGSLLSSFGYSYNPVGQITYWTNQLDTTPARYLASRYDAANQLTNAILTDGMTMFNSYSYAYDAAGNRLQSQINGLTQLYSYNALNQLTATVPVQTNPATYEWDAEKRLTAINEGINRSEFSYDGLGRRVRIVEKTNGVVQSDNYYLWCESEICELRDASGANVLKRLFFQGESIVGGSGSTNYFYTRDHLRSVCEAVGANGLLATRYAYDPYGRKSIVMENLPTTFSFTGDFGHQKSGAYLTYFRVLDSATGRWLSRDPFGELAGINVYAYVRNDPINYSDPLGLDRQSCDWGCLRTYLATVFDCKFECVGKAYEALVKCLNSCKDPPPPPPPCTPPECTCGM